MCGGNEKDDWKKWNFDWYNWYWSWSSKDNWCCIWYVIGKIDKEKGKKSVLKGNVGGKIGDG